MEFNLVEIWLRKDPVRWVAGVMAGLFAALVMLMSTVICAKMHHSDPLFLIKAFAVPFFKGAAMEEGFHLPVIMAGATTYILLSAVLGVFYAQMTGTNHMGGLFGVGITWGAFAWVFINNLFSGAFRETIALNLNKGAGFFAWMLFGISLMSVAAFDRMFRGSKQN